MKRLIMSVIHSVLLLQAFMLGNIDVTRASNHHEAPMVHFDSEVPITNFYAFPDQAPTISSGNQVSVGAINSLIPQGPSTNLGASGLNQQFQSEGDSKPGLDRAETGNFGNFQDLLIDVPDRLKRDPVDEDEAPALKQFFSSIQIKQVKPKLQEDCKQVIPLM
ncbi:MAG: hypothetical protein AB7P17_05800 [Nitrospirales bacterium]|nr:hypothetical protein [Nitrospirales bacterium]